MINSMAILGIRLFRLNLQTGTTRKSIGLTGEEPVVISRPDSIEPLRTLQCHITNAYASVEEIAINCQLDTAIVIEYI